MINNDSEGVTVWGTLIQEEGNEPDREVQVDARPLPQRAPRPSSVGVRQAT